MERVWGGRRLGDLYDKKLPPEVPIGNRGRLPIDPRA